ncbi:MAG: hypothetical protein ABIH99_03125 [Candidatus Micrarchaeota archaeon]
MADTKSMQGKNGDSSLQKASSEFSKKLLPQTKLEKKLEDILNAFRREEITREKAKEQLAKFESDELKKLLTQRLSDSYYIIRRFSIEYFAEHDYSVLFKQLSLELPAHVRIEITACLVKTIKSAEDADEAVKAISECLKHTREPAVASFLENSREKLSALLPKQ